MKNYSSKLRGVHIIHLIQTLLSAEQRSIKDILKYLDEKITTFFILCDQEITATREIMSDGKGIIIFTELPKKEQRFDYDVDKFSFNHGLHGFFLPDKTDFPS
ncbi:MAG: hypothetical protein LBV54_06245 [Puniceicoccales bacterium]|jgi:hypothetical protein|nr:hypothetical protein [Puniceicoccales bacterium]